MFLLVMGFRCPPPTRRWASFVGVFAGDFAGPCPAQAGARVGQ